MNQTSSSALILGAGDDVPHDPPRIEEHGQDTLVICADGGAALARNWNLTPQIIIGDQDSLDAATRTHWESQDVPFHAVSPVKDETDMELAVNYAMQHGAKRITLVGGWGGRIDHSLGNIELLYRLALEGIENVLLTKDHCLSAFCRAFQAKVHPGSFVSLIPLTPKVIGVSTEGLLYPLQEANLQKGSTFSISNVAEREGISVTIGDGVLLVVVEQ
ncbi:MAG TPA: thiamine diphosphokinase [Limnochordia bacterium]|nr:thiamine diphosphokinase [Bacillota bacterium]HKM42688.1 thiamine diphosphokinase [Limnochordia bacterium]